MPDLSRFVITSDTLPAGSASPAFNAAQLDLLANLRAQDEARTEYMLRTIERLSQLRLEQAERVAKIEAERAEQYVKLLERTGLIDLRLETDSI